MLIASQISVGHWLISGIEFAIIRLFSCTLWACKSTLGSIFVSHMLCFFVNFYLGLYYPDWRFRKNRLNRITRLVFFYQRWKLFCHYIRFSFRIIVMISSMVVCFIFVFLLAAKILIIDIIFVAFLLHILSRVLIAEKLSTAEGQPR